jgi:hypothetical protein
MLILGFERNSWQFRQFMGVFNHEEHEGHEDLG